MSSVTDKNPSWEYHLGTPSVTDKKQRLQYQSCSSSVTAVYRTGSYTKFLSDNYSSFLEAEQAVHLGACVHCGIPVYAGRGYAHYVTHVVPSPVVCSSSCNKAARLKRLKDSRSLSRTERACLACGHQFVPTRADAKTCSNKCRQAMFRRRTTPDK
jgi:hypothetical protein